ncbi:hypothetical protein [Bradyrhizobium ottawaense]|uniref:hypothetical protein n=1 Tax=Bradyrhizobium ottawaense TaxID=931866 RepID=UPI0015CF4067|nr:hypothetical protein [Bradyrhizobium ottawaense]
MVTHQGPNPCFDVASARPNRMQFVFSLQVTGNLVEARITGHGYLVVLSGDPKAPICIGARRRTKYEKILQLAALFVLASGRQHHLAQFFFTLAILDHLHLPRVLMPYCFENPSPRHSLRYH